MRILLGEGTQNTNTAGKSSSGLEMAEKKESTIQAIEGLAIHNEKNRRVDNANAVVTGISEATREKQK